MEQLGDFRLCRPHTLRVSIFTRLHRCLLLAMTRDAWPSSFRSTSCIQVTQLEWSTAGLSRDGYLTLPCQIMNVLPAIDGFTIIGIQ